TRCWACKVCGKSRVLVELVLPVWTRVWAVINWAVVRNGAWVYVHYPLTVVVNGEAARVVYFTNDSGLNVPLLGDFHERVELLWAHNGHHAFLGFRHEDLAGVQGWVAQRDVVEPDVHAAVAV